MMKIIDISIILVNLLFFSYYSIQLLIFTDEFALNNLGFFNHAVAGLSEVLGIIFLTFVIGFIIIFFKGIDKQLPFIFSIFILQIFVSLNFWRYVLTDSPGETSIKVITINAIIFSLVSFLSLIMIINNIRKL